MVVILSVRPCIFTYAPIMQQKLFNLFNLALSTFFNRQNVIKTF